MKIKEAILKARKKNKRISSQQAGYYQQSAKNLIHWLFTNAENDEKSLQEFRNLLNATDWELDK